MCETKICKACKSEHPKTEVYFRRNGKHWRSNCKQCLNKNLPKKTELERKQRKTEMFRIWMLKNRPRKEKPILKTCSCCKRELERTTDNFRLRGDYKTIKKGLDNLRSKCKDCYDKQQRERHVKFYKENTEKELKRHRDWIRKNPERYRATQKKSYLKNIKKNKAYDRGRSLNLPDGRVANTLGVKLKDLTPEVIETQRLILKIKRELKK